MSTAAPTSSPDTSPLMSTQGCIAVLNAGSSSIKFALYEAGTDGPLLFRGQVEQIGARSAHFRNPVTLALLPVGPISDVFEKMDAHPLACRDLLP